MSGNPWFEGSDEEAAEPVIPLPAGTDKNKVIFVAKGSLAARHLDWSKHPANQRQKNEDVRVYVIAQIGGAFVKVGVAHNPLKRLGTVQTGSPVPLELHYRSISMPRPEAERIEAKVHRLLAGKRATGEWFSCTAAEAVEAILAAIQ